MGIVSEHLISVVAKHVSDRGVVVWYDPERHYASTVESLTIPGTLIAQYTDSFFALRYEIEHLLNQPETPQLLIYVPMSRSETNEALVEAEAGGIEFYLALSLLGREALKPVFGAKQATQIAKQVEAGKLTLRDLDNLAEHGEGITKGVVSLIFGNGAMQDVALKFLSSERYDGEIQAKDGMAELALLINSAFGANVSADDAPPKMRARFARFTLATEFISSLRGSVPEQFSAVQIAEKSGVREGCVALIHEWRNRQDLRDSYANLANQVGKEVNPSSAEFSVQAIAATQTFLEIEQTLCEKVTAGLLQQPTQELVALAHERQSTFWSEYMPDMQAQWALVSVAGQLLLEADRVESEAKVSSGSASDWVDAYTQGEKPWCLLDTYHRHMERHYHNFDFQSGGDDNVLAQLIAKARHRYMATGGMLSDQFLQRFRNEKFRVKTMLQVNAYQERLRPGLTETKTAYIWVDALRFEMGRELADSLTDHFTVKCEAAIACVPTITEIGMAALLPGTEREVVAAGAGTGKLALKIDGAVVRDRKERIAHLRNKGGVDFFDVKLEDLLPKPKRKVEEGVRQAQLVLLTSQEIDALCEGDNVPLARRTMDEILHQLHRAFRVLAGLGVERFIVAADHGYIFGDELDESMKVDPPRGETVDLHRRVWIGRGGNADHAFLRAKLADFDLGADLELATPWGFGAFKAKGGGKAFFHGGLSLQELIIPLITLVPLKQPAFSSGASFEWTLLPGSEKISTRFFSVQIKANTSHLLDLVPPKIRIEVRMAGKVLSTPVSASYGFEDGTGNVQLKVAEDNGRAVEPNTVTLFIQEDTTRGMASVHLLDSGTGVELGRLEKIEVNISI